MTRWLLHMSRWARNPPSEKQVLAVLAIIALCLVIFAIEWFGYWPEWATAERMRR